MRIAVFAGDGIGPEVTGEAVRVLQALNLPDLELVEADVHRLLGGEQVAEEFCQEVVEGMVKRGQRAFEAAFEVADQGAAVEFDRETEVEHAC